VQVAGNIADGQGFGEAVSNINVGDVLAAGAVSAIIPGLGNVAKAGFQGSKTIASAAKAIGKVSSKAANTPNRAAKNVAAIARNVGKIEDAAADVAKAGVVATVHQLVKVEAKTQAPDVTVSDVKDSVQPSNDSSSTPPPPPPDDQRINK
jgi:hypothetical protein